MRGRSVKERILEALRSKPHTALSLSKRLRLSKTAIYPVLRRLKIKKVRVREGKAGPMSVRYG
jgi:predicted transcriptional regulator